jgi:hypothetical protein
VSLSVWDIVFLLVGLSCVGHLVEVLHKGAAVYFSTLSHKRHDFRIINLVDLKCLF